MGLRLLTILVGLLALLPGLANAQDPTGAIEGAITDSSAAAIRSARVVAVNLDTGFTKERESGPDGFYRLLLLPVGRYRVTVSAPQFASHVHESVEVNVGQAARVNVQLELSSLTETVKVAGDAPLVETSSNALGRVITGRELVDLPLNAATSPSSGCCRRAWRH